MAIKVHGLPMSTCVARVLLFLSEMALLYELVPLDVAAAAHKQQPYSSRNPFGKIPALEDGNVKLFESRAINKYLARKYKDTGIDLLGSDDFIQSTIVDTWMEVEELENNVRSSKEMFRDFERQDLKYQEDLKHMKQKIKKLEEKLKSVVGNT